MEAAGVEPDHLRSTNWLMAHDFRRKVLIPRRFSPSIESPGVPSCPLESTPVMETFWRQKPYGSIVIPLPRRSMAPATGEPIEDRTATHAGGPRHGGFRCNTLIPHRFSPSIESPGVSSCPLESTPVVETFWRRQSPRDARTFSRYTSPTPMEAVIS